MKRLMAFVLSLSFVLALAGCNRKSVPDRPITAYIRDSVTTVDIKHHISGKSAQWSAEGEEVEALRDWASKLEYELFEFEEGQYPGFSYVVNGTEDCYLLIEGYWFSVKNPSAPPVMEPHEEQ